MKRLIISVLLSIFALNYGYAQAARPRILPERDRIFVLKQESNKNLNAAKNAGARKAKMDSIAFAVRFPSGWTPGREKPIKRRGAKASEA